MSRVPRPKLIRLVLLAQLPGLVAVGSLLVLEYRSERTRLAQQLVPQSRAIVAAVGDRLRQVESQLHGLAAQVPTDPRELQDFKRYALAVGRQAGAESIVLATPRGEAVLVAGPSAAPVAPTLTEAMLNPVASAAPLHRALDPGNFAGGWNAHITVPVVRDSRVEYQLVARLGPSGLQPLLAARGLPRGGSAAIMDNGGRIVARSSELPGPLDFSGVSQLQEAVRVREAGLIDRIPLQGVPSLAGYAHSPASGWISVVGVPRTTLYAALWQPLAYGLLPFVVLLPLMLAMSRRLAVRLQRAQEDLLRPAEGPRARRDISHALLKETELRQAAIARELHDAVGSSLAGVSLLLGTARSFTREPEAAALIGTSQEQVARITQQIRQISRGIMPAGQERGALLPALEHFAHEMSAMAGIRCRLSSRGNFDHVSPEAGGHLFRIVQEATNNALRHGRARRVRITLAQRGDCSRLTITDDGRGCDIPAVLERAAGFGVRSMRARSEQIGGTFQLKPRGGHGLRVQVTWKTPPAPETNYTI